MNTKAVEQKLRRNLKAAGYQLVKSRARSWSYDNQRGYMIIDMHLNAVVAGSHFDLSLDDACSWLGE